MKSMLRQPVHTVLLLALCAVTCFAFLSQALQHAVMDNAIDAISSYYRAVGTLTANYGAEDVPIPEQLALLEESPYVEFVDGRRFLTYTAEEAENADLFGTTPAAAGMYLCGKPASVQVVSGGFYDILQMDAAPEGNYAVSTVEDYGYCLSFLLQDAELLAGQERYMPASGRISLTLHSNDEAMLQALAEQLRGLDRVLVRAQTYSVRRDGSVTYRLTPLEVGGDSYLLPAEGGVDLNAPEMAFLSDAIEAQKLNLHTSFLWTTRDMTAIPGFDRQYALSEGRLLTYEDETEQNAVCVIRQEYATVNHLSVGDELTITVWDLDVPGYSIRPDLEGSGWKDTEQVSFKASIVGILSPLEDGLDWAALLFFDLDPG